MVKHLCITQHISQKTHIQSKVAEPNTHAMNSFVTKQKAQYLPIIDSSSTGQVHTGPHVVQSGN